MSGLYRRAIDYLQSQRHLRIVRSDDEDDFNGTPEERAQIEDEIRRAVDRNRIDVNPETFRLRPQKGGVGLPLMVNLIALLVIVGGVYFLVQLFDSREQTLVTRTGSVSSAEGRLLSALREESAQELSRKETEIAEIERRLAEAEAEREQIRSEAQIRLIERERELRTEFEAALDAERARLATEDLTDDERSALLADFRMEMEEALARDLAALEVEAQAEIEVQESAVASVVTEFQAALDSARAERQAIEADLMARETALARRFEQREAELSGERAAAVDLLDNLRVQQEQRQLILDQILGFYSDIRAKINAGAYEEAASSLSSLRDYLEQGPIGSIPELQRRRQVELFLVDTLEQQLVRRRGESAVNTRTMIESAGLLAEIGELIARAESSFEVRSLAEARELYVAALSRIPAVELGYERLAQIEATVAESESARIASLIEEGNALYRDGRYEGAVSRYAEALSALPLDSDALLGRLLDAGYELRADDSLAELAALRDELAVRDRTVVTQNQEIRDLRSRLVGVGELLAAERARNEELATTEDALTETRASLATAHDELRSTSDALRSTRSIVDSLRAELESTAGELQATGGELEATESELGAASERVSELEAEVSKLRDRRIEQQAIVERLDAYSDAFGDARNGALPVSSLELLETKLLVLRIVGSSAIRSDYPDLHDELNAYLDALVSEQRAEATQATLAELDALITELAARTRSTIGSIDALADDYPTLTTPLAAASTESFLERLRLIVVDTQDQ